MSRLQEIERRIDQKLKDLLRSSSPEQKREVVEVYRAIVEEIASRVDKAPRGKLSFGYSRVTVRVLLSEPERRRSYEVVFLEGDALTRDIKDHLQGQGVEFSPRLKVEVQLVDTLPPDVIQRGFDVTYVDADAARATVDARPIELRILVGTAEQQIYRFTKQRVTIGRLAQVLDAGLRPVRRNDVALNDEAAGPNATVSRTHAHLALDADASRYRLFDDGSAHGTTVVRDGSIVQVPKGASTGVLLQGGDEIILGQVHIQFNYSDTLLQP